MNEKEYMYFGLIFPNKQYVRFMNEITTVNLFENMGRQIDENGLYSQRIFGSVGSEKRMTTFAYIDIYVPLLHPRIYYYLTKLSKLYMNIMAGKAYAVFNNKTKDFEASDIANGETGFTFFMKHVYELNPPKRDGAERNDIIEVFKKYQKKGTLTNDKLLVLPAGLRDFEVDKHDRVIENEVNDYYRAIFNAAQILKNIDHDSTADAFMFNLQNKIELLRDFIKRFLNGKKGLINGDYFSRAVEYRSRTVITGTPLKLKRLDEIPDDIIDRCEVGILQYTKSLDPITKHHVISKFISNAISEERDDVYLFDKNMKLTTIPTTSKVKRRWLTDDGLDKVMNMLMDSSINNEPVMVEDHYLAVLEDTGETITYYADPHSIPESKYLRPITYGELFFLSIYETVNKYPAVLTRYPIAEQGSIVPVILGLHTTTKTRNVKFKYVGIDSKKYSINKYPTQDNEWVHGMNIPFMRMEGFGADRDGDQMSVTALMMDDSIEETMELFNRDVLYISTDGKSLLSLNDSITSKMMKFMTR